jgi:hypothetical protein
VAVEVLVVLVLILAGELCVLVLLLVLVLLEGLVLALLVLLVLVDVLVLVLVAVAVLVVDSGCPHSARARTDRLAMPLAIASRRPGSTVDGSAKKSCSVFTIASCVGVQLPLPVFAAAATASKSFFKGPALAAGTKPPLLVPQADASTAAAIASRTARMGRVRGAVRAGRVCGPVRAECVCGAVRAGRVCGTA